MTLTKEQFLKLLPAHTLEAELLRREACLQLEKVVAEVNHAGLEFEAFIEALVERRGR